MLYCSYKNTLMRRTILFDNKADWYWTGCGWKLTKVNYFKTWTSAAVATLTAGTNEHTFFAVLFCGSKPGCCYRMPRWTSLAENIPTTVETGDKTNLI